MKLKLPYLTTSLETDLLTTFGLSPLWWLLGLNVFVYQFAVMWIFSKMMFQHMRTSRILVLPKLAFYPVLVTLTLGASLLLNIGQNDATRSLAALYNLSFWIMGILLIIAAYNSFTERFLRSCIDVSEALIVTIGILSFFALIFWLRGISNMEMKTPLLQALPWFERIVLLKSSTTARLISSDWFAGGFRPRVFVLSPYPTALAALLIMLLPLYVIGSSAGKIRKWMVGALGAGALLLTLSRTAILALIVGSTAVFVLNRRHRWGLLIGLLIIFILVWPFLMMSFDEIGDVRKGSTAFRQEMYSYTIETVMRSSPIIGIGIKPREDYLAIPLGSHSMYLSILLRSGILGVMAFIAFQVNIVIVWFRGTRKSMTPQLRSFWTAVGIALFSMCLWMATEDLDAPQLVAFVYFLFVGILAMLSRTLRKTEFESV